LAALIESVIELLAPRAQAKGLDIAYFIDDRLPATVVGDAARLRQVLLNIAGNAVKFTERGGVAIIVEPQADNGHVHFTIRDTGIGIAASDQARVFRDFEQADASPTRKFGGTGLGLAISKRIVESMGGAISLESVPGTGSTFAFALNLPASSDTAEPDPPVDLTYMTVLIVSPSTVESAMLTRRLARWGAAIAVAADEASAVAKLAERSWDVMLVAHPLAIRMSAIGRLASVNARRRIVMLTPTQRSDLDALRTSGFTDYLIKPVRASSLSARLRGDSPTAPPIQPELHDDDPPAGQPGLSVLVAEDNEINALLTRTLLTRLGHRVTVAADGLHAVEAFAAARDGGRPFDLVLMDVSMPGLDGAAAAQRIRALEGGAGDAGAARRPTPILALTANVSPADRNACLAAGMDGFLGKPLDRERLEEVLRAFRSGAPTPNIGPHIAPLAARTGTPHIVS
jgi:CheY-like chemotaxis protein